MCFRQVYNTNLQNVCLASGLLQPHFPEQNRSIVKSLVQICTCLYINQSINKSINQSINQSLINHPHALVVVVVGIYQTAYEADIFQIRLERPTGAADLMIDSLIDSFVD